MKPIIVRLNDDQYVWIQTHVAKGLRNRLYQSLVYSLMAEATKRPATEIIGELLSRKELFKK